MSSRIITWIMPVMAILSLTGCKDDVQWQREFESSINEFGHRNWIVVADYAYPSQSAPGIKTVFTGADHLEVLDHVLRSIDQAPHIKPVVMLDRELEMLPEDLAPGISDLRSGLDSILHDRHISHLSHMDIIRKLDSGSAMFKVLILKTTMTLPYTSVFIELDCGYWDAAKEDRFREQAGN